MPNSDSKGPGEAYWIGFMMADGYVVEMEKQETQIGLTLKDREQVEDFKTFFNLDNKVGVKTVNGKDYYRLHTYNNELADYFAANGIFQNKTFSANPPENLKYSRHFWRGIVDGDGCIDYQKDTPRLRLKMGSRKVVKRFKEFADLESRASVRSVESQWVYSVHANEVIHLLRELYIPSTHYLQRKKQKVIGYAPK